MESKARMIGNAPRMTYGATVRAHEDPERAYGHKFDTSIRGAEEIAGQAVSMLREVGATDVAVWVALYNVAQSEIKDDPDFVAGLCAGAIMRLAQSGTIVSGDAMTVQHKEGEPA